MVKVSVIVPMYKAPLEYLKECLDSLLAQTMQECEFIVVSDGAPEAECSICEEYVAKDPRFKFYRRPHAGVSAARNYGISQAKGEYITFVDSDDWIQDCLTELWCFAKENNPDIVLWDCILIRNKQQIKLSLQNENSNKLSKEVVTKIIKNAVHLKDGNFIPAISTWCKLYKRELIKNISFSEELVFGEDRIFNLSLFTLDKICIGYINKAFYSYRKNENSVTEKFNSATDKLFISFLKNLQRILKGTYKQEIAASAISFFYESWRLNHLNPNNHAPLRTRINNILAFYNSHEFQCFIKEFNTQNQPLIIKIEYWLLQHKFTGIIWIHAIKALLFPKKTI